MLIISDTIIFCCNKCSWSPSWLTCVRLFENLIINKQHTNTHLVKQKMNFEVSPSGRFRFIRENEAGSGLLVLSAPGRNGLKLWCTQRLNKTHVLWFYAWKSLCKDKAVWDPNIEQSLLNQGANGRHFPNFWQLENS